MRSFFFRDSERRLALIVWLGLFALAFVYGFTVLANHTISPEIALAYLTLAPVDSWTEIFKKFFGIFYRTLK
jgi:hypothetical protein